MPRHQISEPETRPANGSLVARLADELKSQRETGQPMIYEQTFAEGRLQTTVVWDEWSALSLEDRSSNILEAYAKAFGAEFRKKIVLVNGLTVPEAISAGMLPFQIIAGWRKGDPVTLEQCRDAMVQVGASIILDRVRPQLRLATEAEADTAVKALVKLLPGSDPIWIVSRDVGKVDDWILR